jgi:drug/metabolite transporter (DMT)-like permease
MPTVTSNRTGYLLIFLGVFTWATVEITTKFLNGALSGFAINFFRLLFGGGTLVLYIIATRRTESFVYFTKTYPKWYIPATILGLVIGLLIFFIGVTLTQASVAATIFSANPIIVSCYMLIFGGERRSAKKITGIAIGFLGMVIAVTQFQFSSLLNSENLMGNVLVLVGMLLWCVHVIVGKYLLSRPQPQNSAVPKPTSLDFNAISFIVGTICSLPFVFWWEPELLQFQFSANVWLIILYLGIITAGWGYVLFFMGLQRLEASRGINFFYLKPIIATVLAFFLLNEIPHWTLYLAIGIEVLALFLVSKD